MYLPLPFLANAEAEVVVRAFTFATLLALAAALLAITFMGAMGRWRRGRAVLGRTV